MTPRLNLTLWFKVIQRELRDEPAGPRQDALRALRKEVIRRLLVVEA